MNGGDPEEHVLRAFTLQQVFSPCLLVAARHSEHIPLLDVAMGEVCSARDHLQWRLLARLVLHRVEWLLHTVKPLNEGHLYSEMSLYEYGAEPHGEIFKVHFGRVVSKLIVPKTIMIKPRGGKKQSEKSREYSSKMKCIPCIFGRREVTYCVGIFPVFVEDHVTPDQDGVEGLPGATCTLLPLTITDLLLVQCSCTRDLGFPWK